MALVVVAVVLLALGVLLLVQGLRARTKSAPPPVSWTPPPPPAPAADAAPAEGGDFYAAPAPPAPSEWSAPAPATPAAKSGGTLQIVGGAVAIALGVVVAFAAIGNAYPKRKVELPTTVLGQAENTTLTTQLRGEFLKSLPSQLKSADLGIFGTPPKYIVIAGAGHLSSPQNEIDSFKKGFSTSGATLSGSHSVDAGALGGKGECSTGSFNGTKAVVCVFADRGSFEATIDFAATGAVAETNALAIRNLVIKKA